ncbi:uncharacterized protein LOC106708048 [Papilio machaon]|uniref:uncharacterized protein LOC106708048 n=1 Tax=Papilio machaon TaxID=76193 RepID=UPI001E66439B|nr:uncharacterized protein LOC106708048 [Papilio machaon]
MFYINVYGFRNKIKKQKIFQILHSVVFGKKLLSHFCMHAIHPDVDPNLNVVTITFIKKKEADKAINLINGFVYFDFHSQSDLHLSAVDVTEQYRDAYVDSDDQIARDKEVRRTSRSQRPRESQGRSRSPHLAAEITKIDMEIELIQKERILIVEQRKLLLEKKRLELLKEFEPTSINDLERYVAAIERQDDNEPQNVPHKPVKVKCTPVPVLASRAIVKQMKDVLAKRENIRGIITQPLCFTLKKRIIEIMKGKSNLDTDDIIKMYREVYPIESDEVLLDRLEAQINITQAFKNEMQKDFQVVKSDISGPSNTDKGEVNNKTEETKTKESENKEITSTEILDNELDDWLEDDKVNQQDGNNVDEKDTVQSVEVNDKELDK